MLGIRQPVSRVYSVYAGIHTSVYEIPFYLQLREIKEANQKAILNALKHPDANITKLLEETETRYKGIPLLHSYVSYLVVSEAPLFHPVNITFYHFFSYFSDKSTVDYDEPDLAVYAAIDMSTLRDVCRPGMDYVISMEALMHTTPGLQPGYLPE